MKSAAISETTKASGGQELREKCVMGLMTDELILKIALQISARPEQVKAALALQRRDIDELSPDLHRHELDEEQLRWIRTTLHQLREQVEEPQYGLELSKTLSKQLDHAAREKDEAKMRDDPNIMHRPSNRGGWRIKRRKTISRSSELPDPSDLVAKRFTSEPTDSQKQLINKPPISPHHKQPKRGRRGPRKGHRRRLYDVDFLSVSNHKPKMKKGCTRRAWIMAAGVAAALAIAWSAQIGGNWDIGGEPVSESAEADTETLTTSSIRSSDHELKSRSYPGCPFPSTEIVKLIWPAPKNAGGLDYASLSSLAKSFHRSKASFLAWR